MQIKSRSAFFNKTVKVNNLVIWLKNYTWLIVKKFFSAAQIPIVTKIDKSAYQKRRTRLFVGNYYTCMSLILYSLSYLFSFKFQDDGDKSDPRRIHFRLLLWFRLPRPLDTEAARAPRRRVHEAALPGLLS